jgi:outer membrane protein assembly factor BamB
LAEGVVYFGNDAGTVYAVEAGSGTLVWRSQPGRWLDASSPAVVGGRVFIVAENRVPVALDSATGKELWRFATGEGSGAWPVVAGDIVYLGSDERVLYALVAATGTERWHFTFTGKVESEPVVTGGVVYVGDDWNTLYALGNGGPSP